MSFCTSQVLCLIILGFHGRQSAAKQQDELGVTSPGRDGLLLTSCARRTLYPPQCFPPKSQSSLQLLRPVNCSRDPAYKGRAERPLWSRPAAADTLFTDKSNLAATRLFRGRIGLYRRPCTAALCWSFGSMGIGYLQRPSVNLRIWISTALSETSS